MASGAESDHSMTWEDFFGSSTDLSPSILGIYDSMLGIQHASAVIKASKEKSPKFNYKLIMGKGEHNQKDPKSMAGGVKLPALTEKPLLRKVLLPSKKDNHDAPLECNPESSGTIAASADAPEEQANFGNLSANVKRMLSSHSPVPQPKKASVLGSQGRLLSRQKHSNIPLIGVTSKITQASVDIYDRPKNAEPQRSIANASAQRQEDAVYDVPVTIKAPPRRLKNNTLPKAQSDIPKLPDAAAPGREPAKHLKSMQISPTKSPYLNLMLAVTNIASEDTPENQTPKTCDEPPTNVGLPPQIEISRPLSTSSIASSSSGSSCSGNRAKGGVNSAYLASIESLDDQSGSERMDTSCRTEEGQPRQMEMVCEEIVATEKIYIEDLRQVIEGYLYSWREMAAFDEDQLHEVFSNIEDVYKVNSSFVERLDSCGLDPVKISKAFIDLNQHFSVYGDYCTAYPQTIRALTNMMKVADSVQIFREQQAKLGHLLPLGSYLLKPVQRILKYHLLLQNLVKNCECEETVEALNIMTSMARHINDMKLKHEHAVRVQEIQSLLLGWSGPDLTTYGELCAEGSFRVFGFKAMRHAFLFDEMLLLTKHRDDGILAYKSHIMCNNLMLVESISGSPLSFHVIPWDSPRSQLTLQASSIVQKREWALLLKRVILENFPAEIPMHARQLVMELGQNRTDDDIIAEKSMTYSSMRKQLSAPQYLEKRKLERERRKKTTRKTTTATPAEFRAAKGLCSECEDPRKAHCSPADRYASNSTVDLNDDKSIDKFDGCVSSFDSDLGSSQESFSVNNGSTCTDKMPENGENSANVDAKNCLKCMDITENIADSFNMRTIRCQHVQTLKQQDMRSKSKEEFHRSKLPKIATWRRKSEPGLSNDCADLKNAISCDDSEGRCYRCDKVLICRNCGDNVKDVDCKTLDVNMYNSKHLPKKIYQLKKKRLTQVCSTAKFYTDISRNDSILHISESTDSLNTVSCSKREETLEDSFQNQTDQTTSEDLDYLNVIQIQKTDSFKKSELEKSKTEQKLTENVDQNAETKETVAEKPLGQIISQLLLENREFQQILKRHQLRNARRHQRLLKSHSNPEKILQARCEMQPKLERQMSAIENSSILLADSANMDNVVEEEPIYETLRVEPTINVMGEQSMYKNNNDAKKQDGDSKGDFVRVSVCESDYVYLHYDDIKKYGDVIYDIPKKVNNTAENVKSKNVVSYSNCSEVWEKMSDTDLKKFSNKDKDREKPPNNPEVWLKEQSEHFTCHDKKSDSLPRTLVNAGKLAKSETERPHTIASEQVDLDYETLTDLKMIPSANLNDSTLELEMNNFCQDDSLDVSIEQTWPSVENIKNSFLKHPEHRVYRTNNNPITLKSVLNKLKFKNTSEVKNDLSDIVDATKDTNVAPSRNLMQRFKSIISDDGDFKANDSNGYTNADPIKLTPNENEHFEHNDTKMVDANLTVAKPVELLIRSFSVTSNADDNTLKSQLSKSCEDVLSSCENSTTKGNADRTDNTAVQRDRVSNKSGRHLRKSESLSRSNLDLDLCKSSSQLPVYMQGSKHLGARIAQGDYADPKKLIFNKNGHKSSANVNVLINKSSLRPDTLMLNSTPARRSISTTFKEIASEQNTPIADDSVYERSFELIEGMTHNGECRDSTVFWDDNTHSPGEAPRVPTLTRTNSVREKKLQIEKMLRELDSQKPKVKKGKIPPPIPIKPNVSRIPMKNSEKNSLDGEMVSMTKSDLENKVESVQKTYKTAKSPGVTNSCYAFETKADSYRPVDKNVISKPLKSPLSKSAKFTLNKNAMRHIPHSEEIPASLIPSKLNEPSQSGWVKQVVNKFQ